MRVALHIDRPASQKGEGTHIPIPVPGPSGVILEAEVVQSRRESPEGAHDVQAARAIESRSRNPPPSRKEPEWITPAADLCTTSFQKHGAPASPLPRTSGRSWEIHLSP